MIGEFLTDFSQRRGVPRVIWVATLNKSIHHSNLYQYYIIQIVHIKWLRFLRMSFYFILTVHMKTMIMRPC